MSVDEALLTLAGQKKIPPTLRLYGWKPAALSLGYFQKKEEVADVTYCKKNHIDIVRRVTGGGALFHEHEVTYSFVWNAAEGRIPENTRESYAAILAGLQKGLLDHLGVRTSLAREAKGPSSKDSQAYCLARHSCYDMTVDGKKLIGSAQRRTKTARLQHGSLLLRLDKKKVLSCFQAKAGLSARILKDKIVTLEEVLGKRTSFQEVVKALGEGWQEYFGVPLAIRPLGKNEMALVQRLRCAKNRQVL